MEQEFVAEVDWTRIVKEMSQERGWNLDPQSVACYARALARYVIADASDTDARRICEHYHHDHALIAALSDESHPRHLKAWTEWMQLSVQILYKSGFGATGDHALSVEDLSQAALMEITRSLHRFRYQSQLKTWTHVVIVQTARRIFRDSRAQKRPRNLPSFDQSPDIDVPVPDPDLPEVQASTAVLVDLIQQVLLQMGNERLAMIFCLAVVDDRSTEEIGKIVHLHPSRVRALLVQARSLLQNHPAINQWLADIDTPTST